mgnify:FL=1
MSAIYFLWQEDCLQAAGNIEYWKKRTPGIDRIYRDLEYCIYELGLWFARQVCSSLPSHCIVAHGHFFCFLCTLPNLEGKSCRKGKNWRGQRL